MTTLQLQGAPLLVVGVGIMGAGIAQVAAQAGHPVQLFDTREGAAEQAKAKLAATLDGLVAKGRLQADAAQQALARITVADSLQQAAGVEFLHVPFTGGAPSLQALLAGTVELAVLAPEEMAGLAQAGDIRPLAVCSAERLAAFREVPTLRELGWNVVAENMKGLNAPAGLPDEIAATLHDRFRRAREMPAWQNFLERTGAMDGYLDGPGYQAAMDSVLEALRSAVRRG